MKGLAILLLGTIVFLVLAGRAPNSLGAASSQENRDTPMAPGTVTPLISPQSAEVLSFLQKLQDSVLSGLVPVSENPELDLTTTYTSAMAAIAFVSAGRLNRARRVFDAFAALEDPCETCQGCSGGFQQFRLASTGYPHPEFDPNDFWIGDNAWLLVALKYYHRQTGDSRYDVLIDRLTEWFRCVQIHTPSPGIHAGYTKDGEVKLVDGEVEKHPEGSIDVAGALLGLPNTEAARQSILDWLDQEVWLPTPTCFDPGPKIKNNVPTDVIAWGFLSLGQDYRCILNYAKDLTARRQNRYMIERFDRDGYWQIDKETEAIAVGLSRQHNQVGYDLVIEYSIPADTAWFRIFRQRDIDLEVTSEFDYIFELHGDNSGRQFEVKLQEMPGQVYVHFIPLNFEGWRRFDIPYDGFQDFTPDNPPLQRIRQIEFAVNSQAVSGEGELRIRDVRYRDNGAPFLRPVNGFDGFQSEINWLFPEGTAQMSTAYCAAGKAKQAAKYLRQLKRLLVPASGSESKGLPAITTGGINRPDAVAPASAWYFLASQCFNPVTD